MYPKPKTEPEDNGPTRRPGVGPRYKQAYQQEHYIEQIRQSVAGMRASMYAQQLQQQQQMEGKGRRSAMVGLDEKVGGPNLPPSAYISGYPPSNGVSSPFLSLFHPISHHPFFPHSQVHPQPTPRTTPTPMAEVSARSKVPHEQAPSPQRTNTKFRASHRCRVT
jgi:hypothetical protein